MEQVVSRRCSLPLFSRASDSLRKISYSWRWLVASLTFPNTWHGMTFLHYDTRIKLIYGSRIPVRYIVRFFGSSGRAINYWVFLQRPEKGNLFWFFLIYSFNSRVCADSSPSLSFSFMLTCPYLLWEIHHPDHPYCNDLCHHNLRGVSEVLRRMLGFFFLLNDASFFCIKQVVGVFLT